MPVKLILVLAFALIVALFAVQNALLVDITFLGFGLVAVPLSAVIIGMLAIGVLLGVVFSAPSILGKSKRVRELEAEIKKRGEELTKKDQQIKSLENKPETKLESTEAV
ncbi:MAG: YrvD like protein [Bacillota bacterium]|nr:MAG: YrvD like protein [Bacillota bacterium]MBS3949141.1 DUF1049 domain-containing protein [Peptococcaceae bacterium]